jgi:hypothetical protein
MVAIQHAVERRLAVDDGSENFRRGGARGKTRFYRAAIDGLTRVAITLVRACWAPAGGFRVV